MLIPAKPPWLDDAEPDNWVSLRVAAVTFRKHPDTLRKLVVSGTIRGWFDGDRWWVRLEFSPPKSQNAAIAPNTQR